MRLQSGSSKVSHPECARHAIRQVRLDHPELKLPLERLATTRMPKSLRGYGPCRPSHRPWQTVPKRSLRNNDGTLPAGNGTAIGTGASMPRRLMDRKGVLWASIAFGMGDFHAEGQGLVGVAAPSGPDVAFDGVSMHVDDSVALAARASGPATSEAVLAARAGW